MKSDQYICQYINDEKCANLTMSGNLIQFDISNKQ